MSKTKGFSSSSPTTRATVCVRNATTSRLFKSNISVDSIEFRRARGAPLARHICWAPSIRSHYSTTKRRRNHPTKKDTTKYEVFQFRYFGGSLLIFEREMSFFFVVVYTVDVPKSQLGSTVACDNTSFPFFSSRSVVSWSNEKDTSLSLLFLIGFRVPLPGSRRKMAIARGETGAVKYFDRVSASF